MRRKNLPTSARGRQKLQRNPLPESPPTRNLLTQNPQRNSPTRNNPTQNPQRNPRPKLPNNHLPTKRVQHESTLERENVRTLPPKTRYIAKTQTLTHKWTNRNRLVNCDWKCEENVREARKALGQLKAAPVALTPNQVLLSVARYCVACQVYFHSRLGLLDNLHVILSASSF